ncbi:MAG: copper chaperone PCu(A)C [Rhodoferax sp.]|uniref:copper chaperone PCu(A)C n=1 Tax=Polynucleobacter sp. MG-Unter2-18 TaxID=2081052 RepID=UPI001BFE53C7|nr:copper chaperone PCu(A)C [Polynucleobacter sp. MG-Unter2-18]MCF8165715.1 copper chaperone PCu(A)C [Rhodoferax sp.]MCF8191177.1 copper chaperone PCu(A)C [Polynucleobacter sp.]QWD95132.1 copper chaperone PCu(A)C [Polynucleobacter sp. MG-Unter2-18]
MKRNTLLNALLATIVGLGLTTTVKAQEVKVGSIKVENAYTRATVPGQMVAGGFMKIENKGVADQLISASSPVSGEVQLHEMAMDGNVMKMRQVKDIPVPAGGAVELKPGGLHLMFMNIKAPLAAGETVPVKLKFAKAGEVEVKMPVNAMGAGAGHGGASKH